MSRRTQPIDCGCTCRKYNKAGDGYEERVVAAWREVISCAGPYGSPQLLQLSGIGPADVLQRGGVSQIVNLPVGSAVQVRCVLCCVLCCVQCTMRPGWPPARGDAVSG